MKTLKLFLILSSFLMMCFFYSDFEKETIIYSQTKQDSISTIVICFVGDLMCHSTQYKYAQAGPDSFDFSGVFREVKFIFDSADLVIGNLETVTAGKSVDYSGFPFFNSPDEFIYALSYAGFDLLVTANNHALDQGEKGLTRTIEQIAENGMLNSGTFISKEDRDSIRIIDMNGIRISVLSYTENTNGLPIPKGKDYLINLIDYKLIEQDILQARKNGANVVITHFHYGSEYKREPDNYQMEVVDSVIQLGAEIIIGSHPHVVQPVDYFKTLGGKLDSGLVAYSLGNIVSNQRWRYSDAGVILSIELSKNFTIDSVYISDVSYLPTWVFKGNTEKGREYIILPSQFSDDSTFTYLTSEDRKLMKEAFSDTKEIMTKYNSGIKLIEK